MVAAIGKTGLPMEFDIPVIQSSHFIDPPTFNCAYGAQYNLRIIHHDLPPPHLELETIL